MKTNKYTKCILCEGATRQEAVDKFNKAMIAYRADRPTYKQLDDGTFYIFITVTEHAPENFAEVKLLEGCHHLCSECSHCKRDLNRFGVPDKRKKYATCDVDDSRVWLNQPVCDTFYIEGQDEDEETERRVIKAW